SGQGASERAPSERDVVENRLESLTYRGTRGRRDGLGLGDGAEPGCAEHRQEKEIASNEAERATRMISTLNAHGLGEPRHHKCVAWGRPDKFGLRILPIAPAVPKRRRRDAFGDDPPVSPRDPSLRLKSGSGRQDCSKGGKRSSCIFLPDYIQPRSLRFWFTLAGLPSAV